MSTKHYFPDTAANDLVALALRSLVAANPSLLFIEEHRVILNSEHKKSNVALISGGGSGHEPAWSGYVGNGLLSAVACGDIFASPNMKQVLAAIAAVPSTEGTILLITNYTGDKLHFGLAAERALVVGLSKKIVVLAATDDVSIGRSKSFKVGRRGLAGNVITMKVLGALAARGYSFEKCVAVGTAVNSQLASIGSALDHCHVPGRQNHDQIGDDVCVIGAGIHNEPGTQKISPFPSVDDLVSRMLGLLCDQDDSERAFVKFNQVDEIVLLMNNYGGLSVLELGALTRKTLDQLEKNWKIKPVMIYSGCFETSLNGPGFSITLCNLTLAATESQIHVTELTTLLSAETKAPSWPNVTSNAPTEVLRAPAPIIDLAKSTEFQPQEDVKCEPEELKSALRLACERVIAAEPNLTKWDMVLGDGDCGEAMKDLSQDVIKALDSDLTSTGSLLAVLCTIGAIVDDVGGSLGAIFGILLAALTTSIKSFRLCLGEEAQLIDIIAPALSQAVESLKLHTGARVGDRTVMDVLLPFAETLDKERDMSRAVEVAEKAADSTKTLKPSFGRASYVGDTDGVIAPDPGAWALMEIVKGLMEGFR